MNIMTKQIVIATLIILAAATANIAFLVGRGGMPGAPGGPTGVVPPPPPPISPPPVNVQETGFGKFASEEEFKAYVEAGQAMSASYIGGLGLTSMRSAGVGVAVDALSGAPTPLAAPAPSFTGGTGGAEVSPGRVSETNVQVLGIDEPDIVKTDGKDIYFSTENYYYGRPVPMGGVELMAPGFLPPDYAQADTKVIRAFPPAELAERARIERNGELLLGGNRLIVFSGNVIYGYDVSDSAAPKEAWKMELEDNTWIETSRSFNGKIYLVVRSGLRYDNPCPLPVMTIRGASISIPCVEIYRPASVMPVDVTYTAFVVNPTTGAVENRVSFVGASGSSIIYMSKSALYVTYPHEADIFSVTYGFFNEKGRDLFPAALFEKLDKLAGYDLSQQTKLMELQILFEKYVYSSDGDERLRIENELGNRAADYFKTHRRDLAATQIVKIGIDDFAVKGSGTVPGTLLNQFSLDEYEGYLRTAVTVGGSGTIFAGSVESANDVYVLDEKMAVVGSVLDLGLTERIYSARFVGPRGYLVTFRQTDPFYVLDLSDPRKPAMKGELKIPGFSSYLHPVTDTLVLGVGQEGSQVKLSLFDVSSAENPKEVSKYILKEYWSEVASNHRAFLLDDKHQVFFLPAGQNGYVFSYKNNTLSLTRAVSNVQAKRAIYLDNYLYVIGEDRIVALDEATWKEVKSLSLRD